MADARFKMILVGIVQLQIVFIKVNTSQLSYDETI